MTVQPEEHSVEALAERAVQTATNQMLGIEPKPDEGEDIALDYDTVRGILQLFGDRTDEWAGMPVPVEGFDLRVEDRYPWKGLETIWQNPPDEDDGYVTVSVRNSWYSRAKQMTVYLCDTKDGGVRLVKHRYSDTGDRLTMWANTMGVAIAWDLDAEYEARRKLRAMLTPHLYAMYEMTGSFFESSPRSHIIYMIRRARPTIALTTFKFGAGFRSIPDADSMGMKILAAMCLHPIAYYSGTWGGAMVPTDDVIAHLLMIRGDEHYYWKRANQHRIHSAAAGL